MRDTLIGNLNLVEISSTERITQEIVNELSTIPHQLEYLIEYTMPYDAYTLIEELENGKIDLTLQVLFLCILHALNMNIIYESPSNKEFREYSCITKNPQEKFDQEYSSNQEKLEFDYYAFVYQDGTTDVFSVKQQQIQEASVPVKSQSFHLKQDSMMQKQNMNFGGPIGNHSGNYIDIPQTSSSHSMYVDQSYPHSKPNMPFGGNFQIPSENFGYSNHPQKITVPPHMRSMQKDPQMMGLPGKFSGININSNMQHSNQNQSQNMQKYQNEAASYSKPIDMSNSENPMNQTQPSYYPMSMKIDLNNQPAANKPTNYENKEGERPTSNFQSPNVQNAPFESEGSSKIGQNTENEVKKAPTSKLKAGSRTFKPSSYKSDSKLRTFGTGQEFSQTKSIPPPHNMPVRGSYQLPPPGYSQDSHMGHRQSNFQVPNHINSTFNGVLPGMFDQNQSMSHSGYNPNASFQNMSGLNSLYSNPPPPSNIASSAQLTGRLKYFKEDDNYGFIVSDIDGDNIFFHYSELKSHTISKESLAMAKDKYIIRLVFQVVKYVGKYKLSKKAVNIFITEFTEIAKE